MGPKRRPSGRDCALAQATLERLETTDSCATPRAGDAGAGPDRPFLRRAALIVKGTDLPPGFAARAIRLIDLERRARFARVAS
jgi:hypothetical protein